MELHPALIHFPLVLLPLSAGIDLIAGPLARREWHSLSFAILVAGTLFAIGAVVSGNDAAASHRADGPIAVLIERHEDWATASMFLFLSITLGRLPSQLQGRDPRIWAVAALAASVVLWIAAYFGGELVYDHGVGVLDAPVSG
jgi:uncharacterized membrane protein